MGLFERLDIWRLFGKMTNSPTGRRFQSSCRRLVEKAMRPLAAGRSEDPLPFMPLEKALPECRVSLITTTGVHLDDQDPFDTASALGDSSYRAVPSGVNVDCLRISHTHFPHDRAEADINVIFPIERLRELAEEGAIGSVGADHFCFGFDLHVKELVAADSGSAHEIARRLQEDGVDVVLLTPG
ncbi:MAG: hypothetical protein C4536_12980 [Actinobacteria bacterium]|jgi:D-proline reductase (dithiol) PrdB|nr:MAG: hypothetical protein C4536_12980 [Actinomycetota bacterium]